MIQELAQNSDVQLMAILSMMIFLTFFCSMAVFVLRADPEKLRQYGRIPLQDDLPSVKQTNLKKSVVKRGADG